MLGSGDDCLVVAPGANGLHGVAAGTVYVAAGDVLEAVTVADGSRVWSLREQYGGYETPAVTGNLLVVGQSDGTVTAIGEGESAGPIPTPTPVDTPPTPT